LSASPFLTDIDPQAAVKGSRDPLGVQTIWSRLGRHVVGNVTTVSTSVRDFTTTMLGYYFTERVREAGGHEADLATFLKWEQLAAHSRYRLDPDARMRGIERVAKAKADGGRIRIAADSSGQILSNQRTYGLWGLFTGPARASGLLEGEPTRLTAVSRQLVESTYLPAFAAGGLKNADMVVARLLKPRLDLDPDGADKAFLRAIGKVLTPTFTKVETAVFRDHLLLGAAPDRTAGRQTAWATAIDEVLAKETEAASKAWKLSPAWVLHLAKRCRTLGDSGRVAATRLERIVTAESLLAPATSLFGLLLASDGQTVKDVAAHVKKQWGASVPTIDADAMKALEAELRDSTNDPETGRRWVKLADALAGGRYEVALDLLMQQNAFVMKARASAGPWVDVVDGRLRVRYRDENLGDLPEREQLRTFWRHSYFLDALRAVAVDLRR
jgi:hypothetical protein